MRHFVFQKLRHVLGISGSTYALGHVNITFNGTDSQGRAPISQLSQSYLGVAPGVARFDYHILCRDPIGPEHFQMVSAILPDERVWSLFGLVDNHHGTSTSSWLANRLPPAIVGALADLFSRTKPSPGSLSNASTFRTIDDNSAALGEPSDEDIEDEMREVFLKLDDDIVELSAVIAASARRRRLTPERSNDRTTSDIPNILKPAFSGSSVLYTFYDSQTRVLRVATTGNVRAIFGRDNGRKGYDLQLIGAAQQVSDARQMEKDHPGEKDLVNEEGLLFDGVSPLRVFGMAPFKWSKEVKNKLGVNEKEYDGVAAGRVLTPPYLTAEPIVSSIPVQEGDVLVFASSALFSSPENPSLKEVFDVVDKTLNSSERPARKRTTAGIKHPMEPNVPEIFQNIVGHTVNSSVGFFDSKENTWKNVFASDDGWFEERNVATRIVDEFRPNNKKADDLRDGEALAVGVLVFGK